MRRFIISPRMNDSSAARSMAASAFCACVLTVSVAAASEARAVLRENRIMSSGVWLARVARCVVGLAAAVVGSARAGYAQSGCVLSTEPFAPRSRAITRRGACPRSTQSAIAPRQSAWFGPVPPPQWNIPGTRNSRA